MAISAVPLLRVFQLIFADHGQSGDAHARHRRLWIHARCRLPGSVLVARDARLLSWENRWVDAVPDARWANIVGRMTPGGVEMMSFARLTDLAAEWEDIVPPQPAELDGPARLLRVARSLFAHSWFNYEFMTVACLLGFQAMEASFRALYPEPDGRPLRKLANQAEREAILPRNIAEIARSGVALRNLYSHPQTQSVLTVGMAAPMLENTHRLVALVLSAVK